MDDEYANEITKLAVARACLALGFKQCERSALDSMADILQNYMRMLGANAQEQAEISGRVHAGIQDLIPVLESTRPKNTNWKELRAFAFEDVKNPTQENTTKWYQPFPFDVPSFPVATSVDAISSSSLLGESGAKDLYIPDHLPAFPPAHTYRRSTASSKKRNVHQTKDNSEKDREKEQGTHKVPRRESIKSAQSSLTAIEDSIDSAPIS
uniref:Transcription initiation factor TFIID subunit 8 n=1 Tax=Spumella elongata TaxID=89044 RepID=A0A7S3HA90_9STRA|mmetsp:Transcript_42388/g.73710  ORF Transcript_42388/g.73710 Transcript_42388/m.73710 type:complete len:210 (+) Transcript_42388:11-640(+)|eukprot:CAMPEP_0184990986 /NCGR_PEP_ID=MMETSP1098-20130426/34796_1 /TAXON_ID=89044 /ORGANISM="Spumella elongata, Strain CCAP 955/1" /LENGTH=209 /DNA_ID=CAMNT_0027516305 /DNA_START=10 /DNA_END=639 /DNA_ORIENTATION=-